MNGRVMVPMRKIFEALGANVGWDGPTQTVTGIKEGKIVVLRINATKAFVNDQLVSVDPPAQLHNGRTYVPLRFVSESLGANVGWDGVNQKVTITMDSGSPQVGTNNDQVASTDNTQDLSFFFKEWKLNVGGGSTIIPGISYDTQITSAGTGTIGTLVIRSDGTYTWNTASGQIDGNWKSSGQGTDVGSYPIILLNGELGRDYKVGRGDGTTQGRETNITIGDLKGLRWTIGKPAN
ncbi:copper amine oxidase N-terminal domain-containing protein [Heliobacterium chlorum]|uniref:Copper amine oxidase N-terminal domain-containing protein n=2 Tax=Heliobacterium chlorum TaxID=2698 RepID=A0ABR7T707_HELCL|nr:copper amine oxidase N-terminal domain-containing protein [Heliobacterium chlorum]